jgi:serine protease Do
MQIICISKNLSCAATSGALQKNKKGGNINMKKHLFSLIFTLVLLGGAFFSGTEFAKWQQENEPTPEVTVTATPSVKPTATPSVTPSVTPSAKPTPKQADDSLLAAESDELTSKALFAKCNPSVVAIRTTDNAGSGFIITPDGYITTNNHVVEGSTKITVTTSDGKTYSAKLVGSNKNADIAVIKIETTNLVPLQFGDSAAIEIGSQVAAIGNAVGEFANTFTVGYLSGKERDITVEGNHFSVLQIDIAVNPGNSGGPLLDFYGNVIGIVSAKRVEVGIEGLSFAIPANTAKSIIADIIGDRRTSGKPAISISVKDYDDSVKQGLYVQVVNANGAGEKAGLKVGDKIIAVDGTKIANMGDLKTVKLNYKAGDTVTFTIERDGKTLKLKLTFDEELS